MSIGSFRQNKQDHNDRNRWIITICRSEQNRHQIVYVFHVGTMEILLCLMCPLNKYLYDCWNYQIVSVGSLRQDQQSSLTDSHYYLKHLGTLSLDNSYNLISRNIIYSDIIQSLSKLIKLNIVYNQIPKHWQRRIVLSLRIIIFISPFQLSIMFTAAHRCCIILIESNKEIINHAYHVVHIQSHPLLCHLVINISLEMINNFKIITTCYCISSKCVSHLFVDTEADVHTKQVNNGQNPSD